MAEQWNADVRDVGDGWWTWCAYLPGRPETAKSGLVRSQEEAVALANATAGIPIKPADPAWMVEVATAVQTIVDDDAGYTAAITALRLALERGHVVEIGPIREMLLAGQGDDDGSQILPDLHDGMTLHAMVAACVHLLERRRDALDGYANSGSERRPVPSDEELLKAAREDAAQIADNRLNPRWAAGLRDGEFDDHDDVQIALQARRNMLGEMDPDFREVGEPVKWGAAPAEMARKAALNAVRPNGDIATFYTAGEPGRVDLEAALKRAWEKGFVYVANHGSQRPDTEDDLAMVRDVSSILSTLPAKE